MQNFIDAMVEEIVLEGKPFDTQKKYLKKFSENEGLDYESIENGVTELIEPLGEMKSTDSKSLLKLALIQAKEAYVTEAEVLKIVEQINKEDDTQSAKQNALAGIVQSLQNRFVNNEINGPNIDFNVNGVKFKMVKVEGGTFWMGADDGHRVEVKTVLFLEKRREWVDTEAINYDGLAYTNERPVHKVAIDTFYIGETEVTQALWKAVMGNNPSFWKGENLPVEQVNWADCHEFVKKLNQLTGRVFRLPTEAEWEYAARGGSESLGYKYAAIDNLDAVAWYKDNSGAKTHAVKAKLPNKLGLYDMSGNVWEWCEDWYGDYSGDYQTNPRGPLNGSHRVVRGGGWSSDSRLCRVSSRFDRAPDDRSSIRGLRVVLSL